MKTTKKPRRKGWTVHPDDLNVHEWYTVYGLKDNPKQAVQISGMAFRIVAMNLPFIVGRPASDPANAITLDSRYLTFMRVDADYVAAQRQGQETA
jgi:hypothetical protein